MSQAQAPTVGVGRERDAKRDDEVESLALLLLLSDRPVWFGSVVLVCIYKNVIWDGWVI